MTVEAQVRGPKVEASHRHGRTDAGHRVPEPTLANRLRFARTIFMVSLVLLLYGPIAIIHTQLKPGAGTFKRWARRWAGAALWAAGIKSRCSVTTEINPKQPYVFVANHQSMLDILVLAEALPYPFGFLAKHELKRVPLLGYVMKNTACLFIDRSSPKASSRSLREAGARIREGNSILVFPEGSRSRSPEMLPFKRGAFVLALEAGVPVVPIVIEDSYRKLNEPARALVPGTINLAVGEPVDTSRFSRGDSAELSSLLFERMQMMQKAALVRNQKQDGCNQGEPSR